jgi:polar amino acid transport system substrate-binding protein
MRARTFMAPLLAGMLVIAACGSDDSATDDLSAETTAAETTAPESGDVTGAGTGNDCTAGKTLVEGVFTPATGDPAYYPYVLDDDPASGLGFEAAVVAAVAREMGFSPDNVNWVRAGFSESIAPGPKDFDVNVQQFSITDERSEVVTFSAPYYSSTQALVALAGSAADGAGSLEDLQSLKLGAQIGTTSLEFITDVIQPEAEPFAYDDNTAAKAALEANQIDAIVLDLPTAFYVSAVEIEGSDVVAQFPNVAGGDTDDFGMLMEKDNPLSECIDAALAALTASGELAAITQEWMADFTDAPVIAIG